MENPVFQVPILIAGGIIALIFIIIGQLRINNEKSAIILIDDIKSDLVTLNAQEKESAIARGSKPCPSEIAKQICDDFVSIFGSNIIILVKNMLIAMVNKESVDPLIAFFGKSGDILDSNKYGLKEELEKDELYKSTRTDLIQKQSSLNIGRKRKRIVKENVKRLRLFSYGINSSVLLRSVLDSSLSTKAIMPTEIKVVMESIETVGEQNFTNVLDELDTEWSKISKKTKSEIESMITALSSLESLFE